MFAHYLDLSWRSLKRTPLISVLMILAIAIGIGITMTSLSVYHMMSADPIPHKSSVLFQPQINPIDDGREWNSPDNVPYQMTYQDAINLSKAPLPKLKTPTIKSGFSVHLDNNTLKPFIELGRLANREFFNLFDIEFEQGGPWTISQQDSATPVVVISSELNERLFQGGKAIGQLVYLNNVAYEVVGVTKNWKPTTKFYDLNNGAFQNAEQMFMPFSLIEPYEIQNWGNTNGWKMEQTYTFQDKLKSEQFWIQFWVQLDTPAAKQEYGEFLMAYMEEQQRSGRFNREKLEYKLRDVNEWMEYNEVVSEDNKILVALSFMFLAVCVANILGLLLAKFLRRAPEVGVRRALGASKRQVFYQHIVEVSLIGLIGSILGIAIAQLGLWGVRDTNQYYSDVANMDLTMFIAAPVIALAASFIAGLYPAWLVCRTTPALYLKSQ